MIALNSNRLLSVITENNSSATGFKKKISNIDTRRRLRDEPSHCRKACSRLQISSSSDRGGGEEHARRIGPTYGLGLTA
jgi:hypothetical protein